MGQRKKGTLKEIIHLQDSVRSFFESENSSIPAIARTWAPHVDLYETSDSINLHSDIPGVDLDDIKIEVHNNFITIQGQRKFNKKEGEKFLRVERSYGPFQRTFRLPSSVMEDDISATFINGVLTIKMRKDTRPGPDYVRVKVATESG